MKQFLFKYLFLCLFIYGLFDDAVFSSEYNVGG
jgi:hypothetical protein